jgi:hypothetical protein
MLELACSQVAGSGLVKMVNAARTAFLARDAYEEDPNGYRQVNALRLVIIETFERTSVNDQLAVLEDLLTLNHELVLMRGQDDICSSPESPQACITDLVCEVVWQALVCEPEIRVEDEIRHALADG